MRIDLHNHSACSTDSINTLADYERAYRAGRFDVLAITDHRGVEGALRFRERASFPIVVGQEVRTSEGEIIGLFLERSIPRGLSPEETIARIRDQGGLVYVPHPFMRFAGHALSEEALFRVLPQVDIVEAHNGAMPVPGPNRSALAFAKAYGVTAGAGSDAHVPCEIGVATVYVPDGRGKPITPASLLELLAQGEVSVRRPPSIAQRVWQRAWLFARRRRLRR